VNEQCLTLHQAQTVQRNPGGAARTGQAARRLPPERGRLGDQRRRICDRVLRIGRAQRQAKNLVSDLEGGDARANLVNHTGHIVSETGGKLHRELALHQAVHDLPVHRIDSSGPHTEPDLTWPRVRRHDIDNLQHVGAAVFGELRGKRHIFQPI